MLLRILAQRIFFVTGFVLLFFSSTFSAQNVYTLAPSKEPELISDKFLYFLDSTNLLTESDVLLKGNFKHLSVDVPSFNVTKSTIWAAIKLTCTAKGEWYLEHAPSNYTVVSLFQKSAQGSWNEQQQGNSIPGELKPIQVNHTFFMLYLQPGDTTTVLVKLRDFYPATMKISVGTLSSFVARFHDDDFYNSICYGIMIMALLYNLYLYITQGERAYMFYVLYVFFSLVYTLFLGGYSLHFPMWLVKIFEYSPTLVPAAFGIFGMLFTLELFKTNFPLVLKRIIGCFIVGCLATIFIGFFDLKHLAYIILQALGLSFGIVCIIAGVAAYRLGHRSARFYLIGFGAYMAGITYLILSIMNIFPVSFFTYRSITTGSVIESVMLSFAIADKLKTSLQDKQKAQQESLARALENERLVVEQKMLLELKVELENKALVLQMNPHFIFNCLNSIGNYISDNNQDDAKKYLAKFGRLMRLTLEHSRNPFIPLAEEIELLENYIQLEKIRFENAFEYFIVIGENIDPESCYIPPMLIQPHVENAIIHGLSMKKVTGRLTISFHREADDTIQCSVEDDGVGRNNPDKKNVNSEIHHKSLAVTIMNERYAIMNRDRTHKLAIFVEDKKSTDGINIGTKIIFDLPSQND